MNTGEDRQMAVQEKIYTVDDLWEMSQDDDSDIRRFELDEGELVELSPTGDIHGVVALWLAHLILNFVKANGLGKVFAAETGFIISTNPDTGRNTVRAADVAFVSKERLVPMTGKFYPIAPDFAVEIVSPTDKAAQIRRKVDQYLRAGARLVWIVYPDEQFVDVYQPQKPFDTFKIDQSLDGGDVLPGFVLPVRSIFEELE
jgi:Uma2 family endonuclease